MDESSYIVKLIKDKYKSVRQFSFAVDIPYTTIKSGLKAGIGSMAVETVLKMCNALDIKIESLITPDIKNTSDKQPSLSAEEWYLVLKYRSLSNDSKREIEGYMDYRYNTDTEEFRPKDKPRKDAINQNTI